MNTIMPTQKTKKLALMGFGNAGRAFAKLLVEKRKQIEEKYGYMVGFKNREIIPIPLEEVAGKLKMVDPDSSIIREAKNLGISFGV